MELKGKTFLVTGGDNDIGKELISILLTKECNVIAVISRESTLPKTIEKKDSLTILTVDITNEKSVESLYEKSLSMYETIDGIINNAGIIQHVQKLNSSNFETIERIFNLNYYGTLYLSKIFLPHLFSHSEANFVLNVPYLSLSQKATCLGSKTISSLKMLIEGLRSELLDTPIKVMLVSSGIISSDRKHDKNSNLYSISSSDAALSIVNGIEKGYSSVDINKNSIHDILRPDLFFRKMKKIINGILHHN